MPTSGLRHFCSTVTCTHLHEALVWLCRLQNEVTVTSALTLHSHLPCVDCRVWKVDDELIYWTQVGSIQ